MECNRERAFTSSKHKCGQLFAYSYYDYCRSSEARLPPNHPGLDFHIMYAYVRTYVSNTRVRVSDLR